MSGAASKAVTPSALLSFCPPRFSNPEGAYFGIRHAAPPGPTVNSRRFQPADPGAKTIPNPEGVDRGLGECSAPSGPEDFLVPGFRGFHAWLRMSLPSGEHGAVKPRRGSLVGTSGLPKAVMIGWAASEIGLRKTIDTIAEMLLK